MSNPYCTAADLADRKDARTLAELASDVGTKLTDLSTSAAINAALDDAAGDFVTALLQGGLYTTADLAALTGVSLALMKRIICERAILYLMARRPRPGDGERYQAQSEMVDGWLDDLRQGKQVFDVARNIEAGLPSDAGPTMLDYQNLNLLSDRTKNFYTPRARRLPFGRGY